MMQSFVIRISKLYHRHKYWVVLFFTLAVFFYLTPLTGDDHMFAAFSRTVSQTEVSELDAHVYMYQHLNGRIAGNGMSLALVDERALSAAVMSAITVGMIVLASRIVRLERLYQKVLLSLAILLPSLEVFTQIYTWRSGFYNYVPPTAAICLVVLLISMQLRKRSLPASWKARVALLFAMVVSSLFVENATIVLVAAVSFGLVSYWLQERRIHGTWVALLVGVVLGAAIMALSPGYDAVVDGSDAYRKVAIDAQGASSLRTNFALLINDAVRAVAMPIVVVCVGSVMLVYHQGQLRKNRLHRYSVVVMIIAGVAFALSSQLDTAAQSKIWYAQVGIVSIMLMMLMYTLVRLRKVLFRTQEQVLFLLICAVTVLYLLPLIFVQPFGGRNFFAPYVFLVILAALIAKKVDLSQDHMQMYLKNIAAITTAVTVAIAYLWMAVMNYRAESINVERLENASTSPVVLKNYPYSSLLWDWNTPTKLNQRFGACTCMCQDCSDCKRPITVRFE